MGSSEAGRDKGLGSRLKDAIREMKELESGLKHLDNSVDPRLLGEFRDAADHIRSAAWTMQFWLAQHGQAIDTPQLYESLLTRERIRRATQLCNELARDLEKPPVTPEPLETSKLRQLQDALQSLSLRLARLTQGTGAE